MWRSINYSCQIISGGMIKEVYINVNGHWTCNDKQSEVKVVMMENNRNIFLLTYGTP